MLTLGVKRRIKLDVELSKKNVNGYRYILRKVKNIEVLTETDITKVIEKLKETFNVDFVSKDYKNRNNNNNRIYINVKSK